MSAVLEDANAEPSALDRLEGKVLNGWLVGAQLRSQARNGEPLGNFSRGFRVSKEGKEGFLKVLDFRGAANSTTYVDALSDILVAHRFEARLLEMCRDARMGNVVQMLDSGATNVDLDDGPYPVHYFILELAEANVRSRLDFEPGKVSSWKFFVLHQTASALRQLHARNICHQDLHAGNILDFKSKVFKLGDFGNSYCRTHSGPLDHVPFAGDMRLAPPEYSFGHLPSESVDQREGADAYLLGSLIATLFAGVSATSMLFRELPPQMKPHAQPCPSFAEALPYLLSAHTRACLTVAESMPEFCRTRLQQIYAELTHPDPSLRGHPDARASSGRLPGIDRYVSVFDRLRHLSLITERRERNNAQA